MEARRRAGYVRECHGDLHCGNVVRWRGRLVAFDALEFDPALRFIDVTSDLAFLSMDLAARGRPDLRRALIDAWAVTSGDYTAMRLLPYYEAYRALVRAKVSVLRSLQNAEASFESGCHATRYLDWAMQRTVVRAPTLIVMVGLSGSGKTWLARRIAPRLDALHVRSDVERKRLAGLGPLESSRSAPDAGIYTTDFNDRTYARLRDCARDCLLGAMNVVIDAASLRRDERAAFIHVAAECGARLRFVHCHASLAVLRERVAARAQSRDDASEATVALLDRQPGYWEPLTGAEAAITLEVDTSRHESIETALASLDATVQVDRTHSSPQPA
jgi:predicted kinase